MPYYSIPRRRKRGQVDPFDNGRITFARLENTDKETYEFDLADELDGETISTVTSEDVSGVTIDSTSNSGTIVTIVVSSGGDGTARLKVTKSGGDIISIPLKWRASYTRTLDVYRSRWHR